MPRNIRLPNGKILRNVPDGLSKEEIMNKAVSAGIIQLGEIGPKRPDIKASAEAAVGKAAEDLSPWEKFSVGVMETVNRAGGRAAGALGSIDEVAAKALGQAQPAPGPMDRFSEAAKRRDELTNKVKGGYALAGRIAPALATAPIGGTSLAGQTAAGTTVGALTGESAGTGAALGAGGALVGAGLGKAFGRLGNSVRGKWAERTIQGVDEESQDIARLAKMGFKFLPGQASGSTGKQTLDMIAQKNPILGTAHRSILRQNTDRLTEIAAKTLGQNTDDIGPKTLGAMNRNIDDTFEAVADMVEGRIPVPQRLAEKLARYIPRKELEDLGASTSITGRQYMNIRSTLNSSLSGVKKKLGKTKQIIDLMDDLDDAAELVVPKDFKGAYAAAREQYKTWLSLNRPGVVSTGGKIDAKKASNAMIKIFGKQYSQRAPTVKPETREFIDAVRGMASDRMRNVDPNIREMAVNLSMPATIGMLTPGAAALTAGLAPAAATGAAGLGAGYLLPRMALASPGTVSPLLGAGLGRTLPPMVETVEE